MPGDPTCTIRGKVVLITGANGGIGSALAAKFLEGGAAEVLAAGRTPAASDDPRVRPLPLDVTNRSSVDAAAAAHAERIDILVNNSGINTGRRVFEESVEDARHELEVNYLGVLNMCQAFMPAMMQRGQGVVLNMLTVLAHVNLPLMATYCASKAATASLTQALRAEAQGSGVRVCGVFPPMVDTGMSAHAPSPKLSPVALAESIVGALQEGFEDLYPGAAEHVRAAVQSDPKAVERQMAARLGGHAVARR